MYNRLIYIALFVGSLIFHMGCSKVPKEVVSERTMENILYDSYLGEGLSETELAPVYDKNAREVYLKSVLKKYNVTKQEYDASVNWYMLHLDVYTKLYEKVLNRLKKEDAKWKLESGSGDIITDAAKGDTIELWRKNDGVCFSGLPIIGNAFTEIRFNETFIPGDSLLFNADVRALSESSRQTPRMVLTIRYQDESSSTKLEDLVHTQHYRIAVKTDTTKRINAIVAGFYHNQSASLLIDRISLKRIHRVVKNTKHK